MQWLDAKHAQAFAWINDGPDLWPHIYIFFSDECNSCLQEDSEYLIYLPDLSGI